MSSVESGWNSKNSELDSCLGAGISLDMSDIPNISNILYFTRICWILMYPDRWACWKWKWDCKKYFPCWISKYLRETPRIFLVLISPLEAWLTFKLVSWRNQFSALLLVRTQDKRGGVRSISIWDRVSSFSQKQEQVNKLWRDTGQNMGQTPGNTKRTRSYSCQSVSLYQSQCLELTCFRRLLCVVAW